MVRFSKFLLMALFAAGTLAGCTRKSAQDANVKFSIGAGGGGQNKVGSLSVPAGFVLQHVVINVRGPNMPIARLSWDSDCGPSCTLTAPEVFQLSVPSGDARLIQFLGVYKSSSSPAMILYYGDVTQSLSSGDNAVTITANQFGTATAGEGVIMGQYVVDVDANGYGRGPTGVVDIAFQSPGGAPPMIVEQTEMFNGYMMAFGAPGVPFLYILRPTGQILSHNGTPIGLDSLITISQTPVSYLTSFISPAGFWVDDGGSTRRKQSGGTTVLGFFGPGVGSLTSPAACYPFSASLLNVWNAPTSGSNLTYCTTSCTGQDVKRLGGGQSSCSPSGYYKTALPLNLTNIGNGKEGMAPFKGIFPSKSYSGTCGSRTDFGFACMDNTTHVASLQWDYLPNIFTPGGVEGVTLFYKVYSPECREGQPCQEEFRARHSDGYKCDQLASRGFTAFADYGTSTKSASITANLPAGSNMIPILCPYRSTATGRQYFASGLQFWGLQGPPVPINNISITTTQDSNGTDGYLVDTNLSSNQLTVNFTAVTGATSYDIELLDGISSSQCGPYTTATLPYTLPTACNSAIYGQPDGEAFQLKVTATGPNGTLASTTSPFTSITAPVTVGTPTVTSCTTWNTGLSLRLNASVTNSGSTANLLWHLAYLGGTNSGGPLTASAGTSPLTLDTGMLYGTSYTGATLTVKPVHISGYIGSPQAVNFNATSGGVCP